MSRKLCDGVSTATERERTGRDAAARGVRMKPRRNMCPGWFLEGSRGVDRKAAGFRSCRRKVRSQRGAARRAGPQGHVGRRWPETVPCWRWVLRDRSTRKASGVSARMHAKTASEHLAPFSCLDVRKTKDPAAISPPGPSASADALPRPCTCGISIHIWKTRRQQNLAADLNSYSTFSPSVDILSRDLTNCRPVARACNFELTVTM